MAPKSSEGSKARSAEPGRFSRNVSAGFTLWRDAMRWQRTVNAALRPVSLTHTQFLVLASLEHASTEAKEDMVSQRAIARRAGLDEATTSSVVQALAKRSLADRDVVHDDQRSWGVSVTTTGAKMLRKATSLVEAASTEFHSGPAEGPTRGQVAKKAAKRPARNAAARASAPKPR